MRGGKEINGNRKVEQRMQKGKTRIGKTFTQCKKGSAEGKVGFTGQKKRARALEKSPENGFETGKSGKNGDFGAKKVGWGSGEKMGFTADFVML